LAQVAAMPRFGHKLARIYGQGESPMTITAMDKAELDALCLDHIARFKRSKICRFVEALPKYSTGKVLRTELQKLL